MQNKVEDILQQCLEMVQAGASVDQCLNRYPEHANELEPLLRTALATHGHLGSAIPPVVGHRLGRRVLGEWDRHHQQRRWSWRVPALLPRWAAVAASVLLVILVGGTTTVVQAASSVPGDTLYPVKEFRERLELWFARSPEDKIVLSTRLVKERVEELRALTSRDQVRSEAISHALRRLDRHLATVDTLIEEQLVGQDDGNAGLYRALQKASEREQAAYDDLRETLAEALPSAGAELSHALQAIQQAQARVRAALEAVAPSLPKEQQ